MLVFEMYPWHSHAVTAKIAPDRRGISDFIWRPLAELDVRYVFAFGAPWCRFADGLRLDEQHIRVALTVPSRRVRFFALPSGQRLVVSWQPGYNGPPGQSDVLALQRALAAG